MILVIALGFLGTIAFIAFLFARAPVGYETPNGFHVGEQPDDGSVIHVVRL